MGVVNKYVCMCKSKATRVFSLLAAQEKVCGTRVETSEHSIPF